MRRIFNLTVALVVVLLGCMILLFFRPPSWSKVASRIAGTFQASAPTAERVSPFTKPESKRTVNAGPKVLVATPVAEPVEEPLIVAAAAPAVAYPFATSVEIRVGTSRADVLSAYGPPQASAIGADRGQFQERLIYRALATRQTTVVALLNGKVTRAETFTDSEKSYE